MKYILLFMPLFFLSCTENTSTTSSDKTIDTVIQKDSITTVAAPSLDRFTDLPSAIEGCSGIFHLLEDSSSNNYVFVMDLQGIAFIKMDGEMIKLTRTKKYNAERIIKESYSAGDLEVVIDLKETRQTGDEVWNYRGQLILKSKIGNVQKEIEGDIGC